MESIWKSWVCNLPSLPPFSLSAVVNLFLLFNSHKALVLRTEVEGPFQKNQGQLAASTDKSLSQSLFLHIVMFSPCDHMAGHQWYMISLKASSSLSLYHHMVLEDLPGIFFSFTHISSPITSLIAFLLLLALFQNNTHLFYVISMYKYV